MWKLSELPGTVVQSVGDRLAYYDGQFSWLVPVEEPMYAAQGYYYFEDMTEDEAIAFCV